MYLAHCINDPSIDPNKNKTNVHYISGDFCLHNNCELLHNSEQGDFSCLFSRVALAQPFGLLRFIVIILCRPLPSFLFLFWFRLFFEIYFCQGWSQICSKPPASAFWGLQPWSIMPCLVYFFLKLVFVFIFFSIWAMNFYYHSLALQIQEPNKRVWKLNLWLWLSLYLHTGSSLTPYRGQQLPDALCRQPWAHLELQHSCRRAPGLSCSCRSWSRSRNCQWCVLEQLGSICSASGSRSKGISKNRPCFWKVCYESFALGWPFPKKDRWVVGRE